jgi:hypothetical protein
MPLQGGWVEHWLDRFCEPGTHEFVPLNASLVWCTECGKKELADGLTCFFCDIPSSRSVILQRQDVYEATNTRLCVLCYEDLERQAEVRGWRMAS